MPDSDKLVVGNVYASVRYQEIYSDSQWIEISIQALQITAGSVNSTDRNTYNNASCLCERKRV